MTVQLNSLATGLGGVFLGGFLLYQASMYFVFSNIADKINGDPPVVAADYTPPRIYANDTEVVIENAKDQDGLRSIARHGELSQAREVNVTMVFDAKSLAQAGEALPQGYELEQLVRKHLPELAEQECQLLKQKLVSQCVSDRGNVRADDTGGSLVKVSMRLYFVQKQALGTIKAKARGRFVEENERIKSDSAIAMSSARKFRASLYAKIATMCQPLKQTHGNCSITQVWVQEEPDRKSGTGLDVKGHVKLAAISAL